MSVKLAIENLYKVFGPAPEEAMQLAREGLGRDEIYRRTASVVAVDDVSLEVSDREAFVVMGLSGSGKSTLVRCINRLIEPSSGSLAIDGEDVLALDEAGLRQLRLRKVAMVFQHFALFPHRSVAENAAYGLKIRGVPAPQRREKALEALAAVGLEAWADAAPANLSGGMQQRVGLARALAVDPEILLMDEPFSALDPLIRARLQEELMELQARLRRTILFVSHDLDEAFRIGNRIAILDGGRIVQLGTPRQIHAAPATPYVADFVADMNPLGVLVAGDAVDPAAEGVPVGRLPADTPIHAVMERLRAGEGPLGVADAGGRPLGLVTEASVLAALVRRRA